jgi:F-type H+-transporting ATPase subunit delta
VARMARAKRYAQAVFQIAQQTGEYERWLSDLETLINLKRDDIYVRALESPTVTRDDKARLLVDRFPRISLVAVNLVSLLIEKGILGILPGVLQEFQALLDTHRGIVRAKVITAVSLDDDERKLLENRLAAVTGKTVAVTAQIDTSLIGGIVARFGGKLLDGSTRSRLETLKTHINGTAR